MAERAEEIGEESADITNGDLRTSKYRDICRNLLQVENRRMGRLKK